jgi:hypothetical protein
MRSKAPFDTSVEKMSRTSSVGKPLCTTTIRVLLPRAGASLGWRYPHRRLSRAGCTGAGTSGPGPASPGMGPAGRGRLRRVAYRPGNRARAGRAVRPPAVCVCVCSGRTFLPTLPTPPRQTSRLRSTLGRPRRLASGTQAGDAERPRLLASCRCGCPAVKPATARRRRRQLTCRPWSIRMSQVPSSCSSRASLRAHGQWRATAPTRPDGSFGWRWIVVWTSAASRDARGLTGVDWQGS